jgi:hypothetical protein
VEVLTQGAESSALYEAAAKKLPKDEDFGRYWFQQMILRGDIDGARKVIFENAIYLSKAAMVLNKSFNQRKYFYWLLTIWNVSAVAPFNFVLS